MNRRHYVGIFLISFATLLLELALTRVLSVALWHHLSFLVISTAMLGFGASGVVLALSTGLRERAPLDRTLAMLSMSFGATTIASFWVVQHIPFHLFTIPDRLLQDVFTLPLYFLALALPFFWSGLVIALLLTRGAQRVNRNSLCVAKIQRLLTFGRLATCPKSTRKRTFSSIAGGSLTPKFQKA